MKVCYVSAFHPPSISTPAAMLDAWPLLRCLPPELAAEGHEVVALVHAGQNDERRHDGVRYRFINPGRIAGGIGRLAGRWKPRYGPAYYTPALRLTRALREERPDIVHFSGLTLDVQLAQVAWACSRQRIPLVVHFHGGVPDAGRLQRLQRFNACRVSRVLVTTFEQAQPWLDARLYTCVQFSQVVETSSPFTGIERDEARRATGMAGDPVYLSAGRLDAIKDPLTVLRGFERIVEQQPDARLYCHYLTAEMMPEIVTFLDARPSLAERVALRGRAPLEAMEAIYSSADFLLQASLREWSGLAVIEAMSCGCIPIVSDIPSFRMLTGGSAGKRFPVGDAEALARAALSISHANREALAMACHSRFKQELSFAAMASKISAIYRDVRPDRPNAHQDTPGSGVQPDG
ncbi:MAG TPA: glycosyltransferase family 4 protein [Thermomicrobiales bacterium]|nr:glycosyltransferase family 4 protein [Thermomicrobiales bacterium]